MFRTPAAWPLWRESRITVALILAVELSALLVPALFWAPINRADIVVTAGLASLSIAYSLFTCRAERVRWSLHQGGDLGKHQDLLGVWGFAAAMLLPLPLVWVVAVAAAVAEWPTRTITGRALLYRHVYTSAAAILAAVAAHLVKGWLYPGWLGVAAAVPAYMAVGVLAVTAAMLTAGEGRQARGLLQPRTHRVEVSSLAIAVGVVALAGNHLGILVWLSLPAAIGLQRIATRSQFRQVTDDAQLRPMSQEAWLVTAREVVASLPVVAIMRVDTTQPGAVNAVAQFQIGCDAIGYLGADGLGLLLVDCPAMSAEALASRLRTALREKNIEAGVAAAGKPRDGHRLDDLLALCEAELVTRDAANRTSKRPQSER